jgi:serine protease Do
MEPEKIIIVPQDVADAKVPSAPRPRQGTAVPLWWRLLSGILIFCPPLLFLATIAALVYVRRRRSVPEQHAHALHYCYLLLASGILWTVIVFAMIIRMTPQPPARQQAPDTSTLSVEAFPHLPAQHPLTGQDVYQQLKVLVVVVASRQGFGSGVLVFAGDDGFLFLTNRHVVEAVGGKSAIGEHLDIRLHDGQRAGSTVVGLHKTLDLALLWVRREAGGNRFAQPFRGFSTVEVGEPIFVIGHPEGLEFTLSSGLVARTQAPDEIQISAPVSPGSSGGPVFDNCGRLMAVVKSVFDKEIDPNAENLNFTVRVDDLANATAWTLTREGQNAITSLAAFTKAIPTVVEDTHEASK